MAPRAAKANSKAKMAAPAPSKKREREEEVAKPASKRQKAAPAAEKKAPAKKAAAPAKKAAAKKPTTTRAEPVKKIVNSAPAAERHIFVMGEGSAGELGLGATKGATNVKRPRLNALLDKAGVVDVAVGGMHCIALTSSNELLTWGVNDNKALGRPLPEWTARDVDEDASDYDDDEGLDLNPYESSPTAIPKGLFPDGTVFTQVAAGDSSSYAVTDTGLVYGWGTYRNDQGIWGFTLDPTSGSVIKEQKSPIQIANLKNIKSVSCGDNHTLALDNKGQVFAWGSGQQDQLGRRIVARHADKNLVPAPVPLPRKAKIAKIVAGPNHSFAIEQDGSVWAWGLNNFAQTGIPYPEDKDNDIITAPTKVASLAELKISQIGTGQNHTVALTEEGHLYTFGRLENWALGIKITDALTSNPELVRKNEAGRPKILLQPRKVDVPAAAHGFANVACGPDHTIALTKEGKAVGWGFNANFQLGVGRDDDEVKEPEVLVSKWIAETRLDWAGCGGQFSLIGGPVEKKD